MSNPETKVYGCRNKVTGHLAQKCKGGVVYQMKHYAKARVDRYNKRHHYYNKGTTEDLYELVEAVINWSPVTD